jgi:hypothetical protein
MGARTERGTAEHRVDPVSVGLGWEMRGRT